MQEHIYHMLNRGVEKRIVFLNDTDHIRFIHDMSDFNSTQNATLSYRNRRYVAANSDVRRPNSPNKKKGDPIVNILPWALLPNHAHIQIAEKEEGNAGEFSRKVFGGYTKYFNEKNNRSGVLFQGKTKIILVTEQRHFLYLPFYIHANPLDLFQSGWKEDGLKDVNGAIQFLEEYRWSNYRDIIGKGNGEFAHVSNLDAFFEMYDTTPKKYKKQFEEWLRARGYQQADNHQFDDIL